MQVLKKMVISTYIKITRERRELYINYTVTGT